MGRPENICPLSERGVRISSEKETELHNSDSNVSKRKHAIYQLEDLVEICKGIEINQTKFKH